MNEAIYGMIGNIAGATIGGGLSAIDGAINRKWQAEQNAINAYRTYDLNEKAANNADQRTRALYSDFQSPEALRKQFEDAGLSVGLMYGGGNPGGHLSAGAQGAASSQSVSPVYSNIAGNTLQGSMMGAQIANIMADTKVKEKDAEKKSGEITLNKALEEFQKSAKKEKDQNILLLKAQEEGQKIDNLLNSSTVDLKIEEINQRIIELEQTNELLKTENYYKARTLESTIANLKADTALKLAQKDLAQQQKQLTVKQTFIAHNEMMKLIYQMPYLKKASEAEIKSKLTEYLKNSVPLFENENGELDIDSFTVFMKRVEQVLGPIGGILSTIIANTILKGGKGVK